MSYKVHNSRGWRQQVHKEFWWGNILEDRMLVIKLRWITGKWSIWMKHAKWWNLGFHMIKLQILLPTRDIATSHITAIVLNIVKF